MAHSPLASDAMLARMAWSLASGIISMLLIDGAIARAQPGGSRGPVFQSPDVSASRQVTLRIHAPKAESVSLLSSDLPGGMEPRPLQKRDDGVWSVELEPVEPGTYRYLFNVDGMLVGDTRNPSVSESNGNFWSLLHVPGSSFMDTEEVPHGAVANLQYRSKRLGRTRRMHVYTPPGYEAGTEKYPVLYLLHGASDSDDSWTTVGRANDILDNLIATGKAVPMIVVMPFGHTGPFSFMMPTTTSDDDRIGAAGFEAEFLEDIQPYIEQHYRVLTDRSHQAIAGLSMGGMQSANLAFADQQHFGYVGIFSSAASFDDLEAWETAHAAALDNATDRDGLKLLWLATGRDDFLIDRSRETVELFKRHGYQPIFHETDGGHTWINWQQYLHQFAPLLFR